MKSAPSVCLWPEDSLGGGRVSERVCHERVDKRSDKISGFEEDWRPERPMVQRASSSEAAAGNRESRMGLGIGYAAYQSGYNKLFTQVNTFICLPLNS